MYERGKTSTKLMQMINNLPGSVIKEGLTSGSEFWDSTKALKVLAEGDYFRDESEQLLWPPVLKKMIGDGICNLFSCYINFFLFSFSPNDAL